MVTNPDNETAIVITGCGWVTPAKAGNIGAVLPALRDGGVHRVPVQDYWGVPDAMRQEHPHLAAELVANKAAWMAAVALEYACRDASLLLEGMPPERRALVLGCAAAGQQGMIDFANEVRQQSPRFVSPLHFPQTVGNYISGAMARAYGIRGHNSTLACGAASGLHTILEARNILLAGRADVVIAGGADALSSELARGLPRPPSPASEGACLFVMERAADAQARGASVLAMVLGYCDGSVGCGSAHHQEEAAAGSRMIHIGDWTGRCFAAYAPAALAAAIGAVQGLEAPTCGGSKGSAAICDVVAAELGPSSPNGVPVTVFVQADGCEASAGFLVSQAAQTTKPAAKK